MEEATTRQSTRNLHHSRSLSESGRHAVPQSQQTRLSAVREDPDVTDFPRRTTITEDEELDYMGPSSSSSGLRTGHQRHSSTVLTRNLPSSVIQSPIDDDHITDTSSVVPTASRTAPPSYRLMASVSGSVRRPMGDEDLDSNTAETAIGTSRDGPPQSYKPMASIFGSTRRRWSSK